MTARFLTMKTMRKRFAAIIVALPTLLVAINGSVGADDPVKGEVKVFHENGYVRLLFRLDETVAAKVHESFPIVVVNFRKPVTISVDRLNENVPDFISAARIDPDGMAIRIALARKMKVHTIPAAERVYVDLLPEPWAGVVPGLPEEVIEELSNRAREAERLLQDRRLAAKQNKPSTIRVRVASQPTFVRYVFNLPNDANVIPDRHDDKLTLNFDRPIKWDLADVLATLPPTLKSVDGKTDAESATVNFVLNGKPKVRSFREDTSIAVDIGLDGAKPKEGKTDDAVTPGAAGETPIIAPPDTVPAKQGNARPEQPAKQTKGAPSDMAQPPKTAADAALPPAAANKGSSPAPKSETPSALAQTPSDKQPAAPKAAAEQAPPKVSPQQNAALAAPTKSFEAEPFDSSAAPDTVTPVPAFPPAPPQPAAKAQPKMVSPSAPVAGPSSTPAKPDTPKEPAEAKDSHAPRAPMQAAKQTIKPVRPAGDAKSKVAAELGREDNGLRIEFPFAVPTPAAVFHRGDTVWLIFDSEAPIDLAALVREQDGGVRDAHFERADDGAAVVRMRLTRPRLVSVMSDGNAWILAIGDRAKIPTTPLAIARSIVGNNRASIAIPFDNPRAIHHITDPAVGDKLLVITALGPARGFVKPQEFVELRALTSSQGAVLQPLADDLTAELSSDKITISRPEGLSLSPTAIGQQQFATNFRAVTFDTQLWGFDQQAPYNARQADLIYEAAMAPAEKRRKARLNLARFYLARGMSAEALGVIDVALTDENAADDVTGTVLKAIGKVMLGRPDDALKDLSNPQIGNQLDAPVWRAIALARQGKWRDAHSLFKDVDAALGALPIELQRMALHEELHVAIEVRDFSGAQRIINELEMIGVPAEMQAAAAVLAGRLAQGLGRNEDALTNYRAAATAQDQRAAAQARLREIMLRFAIGDMQHKDVVDQLETLTTVWRGDETEVEGLKLLAHLYTKDKRYRDAFHVMRSAMLAHPNSELTRQIQEEAAASFESLFLDGKVDPMPAIEALALFYDYRDLTPIGRRGDEMIRKLADRLVAVDLLGQAAELLQHQVEHRLHGAARAQVAARLAVIHLMNHKSKRALEALRTSRVDGLSSDLRDERLLLEARALSETGRHDLALEMIANIKGREAVRLRADISWAAKHWRRAAEQIELLYGERWREFTPLSEAERVDILRAAIGYALADEALGLSRFREKYAAKMAETPDQHAFEVVTAPVGATGTEFKDVASKVGGVDTLDEFLNDMRKRYPEAAATVSTGETQDEGAAAQAAKAQADPAAASPLPPTPAAGTPQKLEPATTGSIARRPKARVPSR